MSDSMVERVARALAAAMSAGPYWRLYEHAARAAIEAMREPTPAMVRAGAEPLCILNAGDLDDDRSLEAYKEEGGAAYRAMIDAALKE